MNDMRDLNRFAWHMLLQAQRTDRMLRLSRFRNTNRLGWAGQLGLNHKTESMFGEQAAWRDWIRKRLAG